MALEDSAALGLVFSKTFYPGSVPEALKLYEKVRRGRATRVQAASARARENIHERIGFTENIDNPLYKVLDEGNKLTIAEMNGYDMRDDIRSKWPSGWPRSRSPVRRLNGFDAGGGPCANGVNGLEVQH